MYKIVNNIIRVNIPEYIARPTLATVAASNSNMYL